MARHRREVSRVEGFSDAVFAFAVTLLVVSLEVPKTYLSQPRARGDWPAVGGGRGDYGRRRTPVRGHRRIPLFHDRIQRMGNRRVRLAAAKEGGCRRDGCISGA